MNYTTVAVIMAETVHRSIKRSACLEHLRTVSLIGMEARGSPAPDQRAVQDGAQSQLMPAKFIKAFDIGNKNDPADARTIWMVTDAEQAVTVKTEG